VKRTVEEVWGGPGGPAWCRGHTAHASARRRGRGGSVTITMPLRSASSRVVSALHTRHESS